MVYLSYSFLIILSEQNKPIQYTMDKSQKQKDQSQKINFLGVTFINTDARKYEFKIYCQNAITNVQVGPHLLIHR